MSIAASQCTCDFIEFVPTLSCDVHGELGKKEWTHLEDLRDRAVRRAAIYERALRLIAAPKRPDGTYNRSREACEELAREALDED